MLSVKNRFHGHNSVRRVYKTGRPFRGSVLGMHINKKSRSRNTKVAVVVSKKVYKSAVKRNRIRRRLYEVVRYRLPKFVEPVEIVITVYQPEIIDIPHTELENTVDDIFNKARLFG